MGGLFSSFGKDSLPDVYFDLQNVTPSPGREQEIFDKFNNSVIIPSESIFSKFKEYKDGQEIATQAMVTPTQENKDAAWDAIYPNIQLQMEVYHFAQTITKEFVSLLNVVLELTSNSNSNIFADFPAVTKCFALCFDICLKFDDHVLKLPKLVNDLAFFRRNAKSRPSTDQIEDFLNDSNHSTVFWATPMPFMSEVINAVKNEYAKQEEQIPRVVQVFGAVSDVCTSIGTKSEDLDIRILCLRCITGSILIYDHLSETGAYNKAKFHVAPAIEFLCSFQPKQAGLINFIKYSSKTYDKPTTDPKIKAILEAN